MADRMSSVKATVKKSKHSWGQMMTVHHGNHFSIPLHPEHTEKISTLPHGKSMRIQDETGNQWKIHRHLNKIHFSSHGDRSNRSKTVIDRSHFFEKVKAATVKEDAMEEAFANKILSWRNNKRLRKAVQKKVSNAEYAASQKSDADDAKATKLGDQWIQRNRKGKSSERLYGRYKKAAEKSQKSYTDHQRKKKLLGNLSHWKRSKGISYDEQVELDEVKVSGKAMRKSIAHQRKKAAVLDKTGDDLLKKHDDEGKKDYSSHNPALKKWRDAREKHDKNYNPFTRSKTRKAADAAKDEWQADVDKRKSLGGKKLGKMMSGYAAKNKSASIKAKMSGAYSDPSEPGSTRSKRIKKLMGEHNLTQEEIDRIEEIALDEGLGNALNKLAPKKDEPKKVTPSTKKACKQTKLGRGLMKLTKEEDDMEKEQDLEQEVETQAETTADKYAQFISQQLKSSTASPFGTHNSNLKLPQPTEETKDEE